MNAARLHDIGIGPMLVGNKPIPPGEVPNIANENRPNVKGPTEAFEQAEKQRVAGLELENRLKDEFFHHVAYELRSPLTNIIGFSQLILDPNVGELNGKQKDYIGHIINSASSILAVVNDILESASAAKGEAIVTDAVKLANSHAFNQQFVSDINNNKLVNLLIHRFLGKVVPSNTNVYNLEMDREYVIKLINSFDDKQFSDFAAHNHRFLGGGERKGRTSDEQNDLPKGRPAAQFAAASSPAPAAPVPPKWKDRPPGRGTNPVQWILDHYGNRSGDRGTWDPQGLTRGDLQSDRELYSAYAAAISRDPGKALQLPKGRAYYPDDMIAPSPGNQWRPISELTGIERQERRAYEALKKRRQRRIHSVPRY